LLGQEGAQSSFKDGEAQSLLDEDLQPKPARRRPAHQHGSATRPVSQLETVRGVT
jgi:hypothetical protein